jgi:Transposase DDE domain
VISRGRFAVNGFALIKRAVRSVSPGPDDEGVGVVAQDRPLSPDLLAFVALQAGSVQPVAAFEVTDPADRNFYSFERFQKARATGAQLLWRVKSDVGLPREQTLPDGSYLTSIYARENRRARRDGVRARVIEYELDDPGRAANDTRYRLLTTILDPDQAPAQELAPLYAQRWEFEGALDELKVHQRGPRVVLRSKTPDGVIQEMYGYLCVHYAIRWLMHTVALETGHDPHRLSFTRTLRVARRTTASHAGFSPRSAQ